MRSFLIFWLGQFVSLVGSGISRFALGIWVLLHTRSVLGFSLMAICESLPALLLAPAAGVVADTEERRGVVILGEVGAALATAVVVVLLMAGYTQPWIVYVGVVLGSSASTFQRPAATAAITQLVPREGLGRANGMMELGSLVGEVAGPAAGGLLLAGLGIMGVLALDLASFGVAVLCLLVIRFPALPAVPRAPGEASSTWSRVAEGWHYVREHRALLSLLAFTAVINLTLGLLTVMVPPLLLALTSPAALGGVLSVFAVGGACGGVVMSVWGGPRRREWGVLGAAVLWGGGLLLAGVRPSLLFISCGGFGVMFSLPVFTGCMQALWQAKVAPELQGRLFALRFACAHGATLVSYALAGPLADQVFEPLLLPGGPLVAPLGPLIGSGPGRGIALLFMLLGVGTLVAVGTVFWPRLRRLDVELPDRPLEAPLSS